MRLAACHPDRKHHTSGLCANCYGQTKRREARIAENRKCQTCAGELPPRPGGKIGKFCSDGCFRRALHRRQNLKKYGLTPEQYDEMLGGQGGVCAVCGELPREPYLCVDHDHATGAVRGLVHRGCNVLVGMLESPLRPAAEAYLARSMN